MTVKKNQQVITLQVTDGLSVAVIPSTNHEFTMTSKEVSAGYGVGVDTIRRHKLDHKDELIEGKHFLSTVSIPHAAAPGASRGTLWTKRGIVRLGFFIKSDRARMFRDWAEELVLSKTKPRQQTLFEVPQKQLPARRNHNRLTSERLLSIMSDVAKIDDREIRLSLTSKLMIGGN